MAVVSQSKSSNVYVPGIAGKTPDGSDTSFAMSTIVTKTGGVNDDGSSGFTRQIVRYEDKNEVPSNPNETYVDSNTGLSKRRYRIGDARTGQDALALYDYGDGTGTPSKIGDVIAVGNNLNGGLSLEYTAKSTEAERKNATKNIINASKGAINSVKNDFKQNNGLLSAADQKGLESLKKKNGFDRDPIIGTTSPLDSRKFAQGPIKRIEGTRTNFKSTNGAFQYPRDIAEDQDIIKFNMLEYSPRKLDGIGFGDRRDIKEETILGSVILPVSSRINDTNSCDWGENKMNALDIVAGQAAFGFLQSGFEGLGDSLGKIAGDIGENKDASKQFAVKSFLGAAVGQAGQGLFTRQTGAIINPNIELLFNSPQLREFSFDFTLAPRERKEAEEVIKIIRFFKQGMAPIRDTSRLFLKSPHTFQVEFLKRVRGSTQSNPFIGKKKECALTNVSVDYTPNGTYSTYDDGVMTAYKMSLTFKELEAVYNDDYEKGKSAEFGLPAEIGF